MNWMLSMMLSLVSISLQIVALVVDIDTRLSGNAQAGDGESAENQQDPTKEE